MYVSAEGQSDWEQALGRQQFGPWLTGSADALSEKVA